MKQTPLPPDPNGPSETDIRNARLRLLKEQAKLGPAKKNCKKCYGTGRLGFDVDMKVPVVCQCRKQD